MGIFVGNGQFVHAPSSGGTVQRVRMDNPYFAKRFTEARSILPETLAMGRVLTRFQRLSAT